jgi:predicted permease
MNSFFYQIKQAWLSLKQKPGFVVSVVTTMGMTLGALLCVLTLAYVMLLKPLPYPEQDRLYRVEHQLISNENKVDGHAFTYANLMHLYNNQTTFSESTLSYFDAAVLTSSVNEPMVPISFVTPLWFDIFATKMALGRTFEDSEKLDTYNPVAILSYQLWQEEFAGKKNILDKKVEFSGKSYRIIGVTAQNNIELPLAGPGYKTQIYVPWDFNPFSEEQRKSWGDDDSGLSFIGKIKPELVPEFSAVQVNQTLTNLVNDNWQLQVTSNEFFKGWGIRLEVSTLKSFIVADGEKSVYLLMLGAFGLVLIACANIANLFVSRTAERQQQLAIRAAVGASKSQLFRTIMAEIGVIMLLSIMIAQIFIFIGFNILTYYLGDFLPRIDELTLNNFSILISVSLLLLLTLFFSFVCRKMINYSALNSTLQSSGKGSGVQVSKKVRNILISSQIAIATSLVFINVVLYKDANALVEQPLGYETDNIVAVVLSLANIEQSSRGEKLTGLKRKLMNLPKVTNVSQAMRPSIFSTYALSDDASTKRYTANGKDIDDRYFGMIKQQLIEGDNFSAADIKDDKRVAIINDVFARLLVPNGSAIGMKFNNGLRVIGVVKSINVPGRENVAARFYLPASLDRNMLLIKIKQGQELSRTELITTLKEVSPSLSLFSFSSLTDYKNERLFAPRTTAITTVVLAMLTLFLSGLGLYGVLSYSSQMRRFEIGTRLAIGAKGNDIVKLVFKDNSGAIISGVIISILVLLGVYIGFSNSLAEYVSIELIPLYIMTLALISLISFFACYMPLRQYINQPAIYSLRGSD